MTTTTNTPIISWRTAKNTDGTFTGRVVSITPTASVQPNGHYAITETIKTVTAKSRATAKRRAIKWVRYFRAQVA